MKILVALLGLFTNISKDTAIHIQHVAVNGVGGVGGKEYCGTAKLFRLKPSAGRGLGADEESKGWREPSA